MLETCHMKWLLRSGARRAHPQFAWHRLSTLEPYAVCCGSWHYCASLKSSADAACESGEKVSSKWLVMGAPLDQGAEERNLDAEAIAERKAADDAVCGRANSNLTCRRCTARNLVAERTARSI